MKPKTIQLALDLAPKPKPRKADRRSKPPAFSAFEVEQHERARRAMEMIHSPC